VIEPLDDELRTFVDALRQVDRPSQSARAATWAAIDARIAAEDQPRRIGWATIAALAAAVLLCVGIAAAVAWRGRAIAHVEASHHGDAPVPSDVEQGSPQAFVPVEPRVEAPAPEPIGGVVRPAPEASEPVGEVARPAPEASEPVGEVARPEPETAKTSRAKSQRRPQAEPSLRPEEVASFRRAQAALAEERGEDALQALDEHGRRFPGGIFNEERQISRAAALCLLGRTAEARAARNRFLRAYPGSHLAERARTICREKE
jgi:hypothetical protein